MRLVLLFAFSALMLHEAYMFTDETDKQALLEFKSEVSEDKRVVLSSWNKSFPLCSWTGVTCGRKHKRVTSLDLGGLQLGGVISPFIGNLSHLISLNLSTNSFGGTIPLEMGKLFRLQHLFMGYNFLKGEVPASLFNCSRLLELQLYSNPLGQGVPWELGSLTKLVVLNLGRNNLKGKLPASLGNLTSLRELRFEDNNMTGGIHNDVARLAHLVVLELAANSFSGDFPSAIHNLSSLEYLNIDSNGFSGSLSPDFGKFLPNLHVLYMGNNYFTGAIPITLANISTLQNLGMGLNRLTGSIPPSFGKVQNLQILALHNNSLGSFSAGDLDFLGALTNCTQLDIIRVANNMLGGDLPASIANLSMKLIDLSIGNNHISGNIPHGIGNLISLQHLGLYENLLTGQLPTSLGKLSGMGYLNVGSNRMSGEIPSSIGNITRLEKLVLSNNNFEGIIPPSIAKCSYLLHLNIGNNKLRGFLPKDVGQLESLVNVSVAYNKLSGKLPETMGKWLSMERLYVQGNSFEGTIPDIRGLLGVEEVDLSNNNLSGTIPGYLTDFKSLEYLNLSVNNFEGKVPKEGKFKNATIVSVFGNKDLCGGVFELQLKPCFLQAPKSSSRLKKVVIGVMIGVFLLLVLVIATVSHPWFKKRKKNKINEKPPSTLGSFHEKISYGDVRNATGGFSSSNLVGSGSFGTVFKALLSIDNNVVAVKVLNLQRRGAMKSFMAECESLKHIRHRNLVKLLTTCSSIDFQGNEFRALIYEFMPNGSLDMWLHPKEVEEIRRPARTLTFFERLNIAIDVASVLDYLHVHGHEAIFHCDLKPSNVLLDDDLNAHVSDFGLARILVKFDQEINQLSSAGVIGTIGYAAPEYGMGGRISTHGDVYSFGILLLELFSGKRPTNELFCGNLTLRSYINSALPMRVLDVMDESILHNGLTIGFHVAECFKLVLEIGLRCCEESLLKRMAMSEAVKELTSIRVRFFRATRKVIDELSQCQS